MVSMGFLKTYYHDFNKKKNIAYNFSKKNGFIGKSRFNDFDGKHNFKILAKRT